MYRRKALCIFYNYCTQYLHSIHGAGMCDEPLRASAWEARLFINNKNSCSRSANAMYGVFVIAAL